MRNNKTCYNCKFCSMDMDMEPFCTNPLVLKDYNWELVLHSKTIANYCPSPALPLFKPMEEN